jgi:CHRD domain
MAHTASIRASRLAVITAAAAAMASTLLIQPAEAAGRPLETTLTGAAEVPGPGDPDGSGTAQLTVNPGQEEICYSLEVSGIAPAQAAHIHAGTAGEAGPVVVHLAAPTDGTSTACTVVDRDLALAIIRDPDDYYVNVHNAEFPDGAVRGQLSR